MKTFASESYTVAWFKIADFIARGEKERALHMYRLLMHSVTEPAISYQLEGDILLAFEDIQAVDRYHKAVDLYKKSGKLKQAIAIYEQALLFLNDETMFKSLISLYIESQNIQGFTQAFLKFSKICLQDSNQRNLDEFIVDVRASDISLNITCVLYANYIRSILMYGVKSIDFSKIIEECIKFFLDSLKINKNLEKEFKKFLADLKFLDSIEYQKVENFLQK